MSGISEPRRRDVAMAGAPEPEAWRDEGAARRRTAGGGSLAHLCDLLLAWAERSRQRRTLAGLNDALLKDLGISRADADAECRKPFWRA